MEKWTRLLIVVATVLLLLTFVGVGVRLLMSIHHTLLLFALGGLLAYALDPLVGLLQRARMKRETSVALVFVGVLVILGLGIWSLGGHLAAQVSAVTHDAPAYRARGMAMVADVDQKLSAHNIHFSLVETIQHPPAELRAFAESAGRVSLPFVRRSVTDLGESLIVLLIALYFLLFAAEMRVKFNELLPENLRHHADLWETDVNRILGGFVRGQLVIALIMGALAALGCLLLGIHLWLIIGLIVVVASLIPVFGPYIGALPAIVAALIEPVHFFGIHLSPAAGAIAVIVLFILINEGGSKVLYPKLVGSALGLHTVLVLFVLFAGLELDGIVGVLFAAPVTALAIVTLIHLYRFWQDLPDNLLSVVAQRQSRRPETHNQINHPQPDPPAGNVSQDGVVVTHQPAVEKEHEHPAPGHS